MFGISSVSAVDGNQLLKEVLLVIKTMSPSYRSRKAA